MAVSRSYIALKRQYSPFWKPFQIQMAVYGVGQADAQREDDYSTPCQDWLSGDCLKSMS